MNPIQDAIEEIESRAPGASFSYRALAKKYDISRNTLLCTCSFRFAHAA
jgi:hypothetical protein